VGPDEAVIEEAVARALRPFNRPPGDLDVLRERLFDVMWEDAGILRDAASLERAAAALEALDLELQATGLADPDRAYNLTWHDWLNLESQILVSRAICAAALAREDSRGAHYRTDFPATSALETSTFTRVRLESERLRVTTAPVAFTRVRPGETLLGEAAD